MNKKVPSIDFHSHYMPPAIAENTMFFKMGWSDLDRQLGLMDQLGIEQSVLLYPTSDAHLNMGGWTSLCRIYNAAIADVIKKYPSRFIGGGILPPDNSKNLMDEIKHIQDSGLKVISLASSYDGKYLDDEIFFPVYSYAQEKGVPIHVHSQIMNPIGCERLQDPLLTPVLEYVFDVSACIGKLMMSGVLQKFDKVKFVFAHYGGVLPIVKERFDTTYQMLRRRDFVRDIKKNPSDYFKNLYFDMSGSKSKASLLCALELTDFSHILFGSDFPANQNVAQTIDGLKQLDWNFDEDVFILSKNAHQLIEGIRK